MNNEKQRDRELDSMLDALRGEAPTAAELKRWNEAIAGTFRRGKVPFLTAVAATLLGAVVGAAATHALKSPTEPCMMTAHQELRPGETVDATFELTSVKLD